MEVSLASTYTKQGISHFVVSMFYEFECVMLYSYYFSIGMGSNKIKKLYGAPS